MTPQRATPTIQNLVAVASGKGGVGKTWLASTLTHALGFVGQRALLIDGDLGMANVDVQLGLSPSTDVTDALAKGRSFVETVTPVAGGAGSRGGFDVLAGRSGSASFASLEPTEWARLMTGIEMLSGKYDHVLIDLGAGAGTSVLRLARVSGAILIVLTDEPTSLTDAYALVKKLAQFGRADRIFVVTNMAADLAEGKRTADTLIKAAQNFLNLRLDFLGAVCRDRLVKDAIRHQQPLLTRHPQSSAASEVSALADRLVAQLAEATSHVAVQQKLATLR
jgi:flagellar biosynthesis protein FlhG